MGKGKSVGEKKDKVLPPCTVFPPSCLIGGFVDEHVRGDVCAHIVPMEKD